ncbi:MAG: Ppx/GppA family phosphatase [Planktomarina sp.]
MTEETAHSSPFGAPLFNDPSARLLKRVGVIDVGSNSVRMVVFDGAARSPAYFYNEKIMCGLGAGLRESGVLNPEGRVRALAAMHRFAALCKAMDVQHLTAVATAAVRDASDGPDFATQVETETGIKLWIVDGKEEARLAAQGVLLGRPGYYGLVCDIGGASMELAEIAGGQVGKRITSPLGPLKLQALAENPDDLRSFIRKTVTDLAGYMGPQSNRLFLVGGSWRAIAKIDMQRRGYPLHVLHEYRMTAKDICATADMIATSDPEKLRQNAGVASARMALVPLAVQVLQEVVRQFDPVDIAVSSYGLREGVLYEQMPQKLKDRDPLIEACYYAESKDARSAGFGKKLFQFVLPLFDDPPFAMKRMIKAACLLHDVNWRAHPDFRAEVCFDTATRANMGGLKHSERVFLGTALMYRYRSQPVENRFEDMAALLTHEDLHTAQILGRAMRLGAMLWDLGTDGALGVGQTCRMEWTPQDKTLTLHLPGAAQELNGEVVTARFEALAKSMGAKAQTVTA